MRALRAVLGVGVGAVVLASAAGCSSSGGGSNGSSRPPGGSSGAASSAPRSSAPAASSSTPLGARLSVKAVVEKKKGQVLAFVPVTVGGRKSMFVLDSGAATTVLDKNYAKSAGLTPQAVQGKTKTIGCTMKPAVSQVSDWSLGAHKLPVAKLITQDLGLGTTKVGGVPVGGLLGADVQAAARVVTIDYAAGKVTFGAAVPSGGTSVDVRVVRLAAGVAVTAPVTRGRTSLRMIVDTGASRTTLSARAVSGLQLQKSGAAVKVNAAGCPAEAQPVRLTGAKIGEKPVPAAVVNSTKAGTPGVPGAVGLFGSDLLSTYRTVTIDYAGAHLILGR